MADAHAKNHDYHLVNPSPWPIIGATSALFTAIGAIMWMKGIPLAGMKLGGFVFGIGFIGILYTMVAWWADVTMRRRPAITPASCRSITATA